MKKIILLAFSIFLLGNTFSQSYSDGCMEIDIVATWAWCQEYEDPFANDESNWRWWFADVANYDAAGWSGGQCLAQGGFFMIGWWNHSDYTVYSHNFTGTTVPRFFNLRGAYEGDDCGGSCDGCTSLFDDDDYRFDETIQNNIDYRAYGPPNSTGTIYQRLTTNHGSSDYGGEWYIDYTAPKPTATPSITQICNDGSSTVTVTMSGAIYGGAYYIYRDGGFLTSTTSTTYTLPSETISRTYTVYTNNGGGSTSSANPNHSNCFAQFSISAANCDFNCASSGQVPSTTTVTAYNNASPPSTGTNWTTSAYSGTSIFPANSYITDIDAQVRFNSGTATCADLTLYHVDPTTASNSLLISTAGINSFSPVSFVNNSANTSWRLFADNPCSSTYNLSWYQVDVCACKTANYGTARVNGASSGFTICEDDPGTISLTHDGSTSALDNNGYGDELRWYTASNLTGYVGSGNPLILPSPTTSTTYYCLFFVDGTRCRSDFPASTFDENVTVTVTPVSVPGTLAPTTQTICVGTVAAPILLTGQTGSVVRWEYSPDGGGSWPTTIANTLPTYLPTTTYTNAVGTHTFRAVVQNSPCGEVFTSPVSLVVNPNPVAGNVVAPIDTVCTGTTFSLNANAFSGALQWQVSSVGPSSGFVDIGGANSPTYATSVTNAGTSPISRWYRTELTNTPCLTPAYSTAVRMVIEPIVVPGTITSDQTVCLGGNVADITLSGNNANVIRWEVANNVAFTAPNTIVTTSTTLTGATIDALLVGSAGTQLYVRSFVENTCSEEHSNTVIIRYNQPESIVMANATGTCPANNATTWVNIYDPTTNRLICSVNDFGQNLGDVTASVYYHSGSAFTVAATSGQCTGVQMGVLNRNYVINSVNAPSGGVPVGIRLYFTDAELTDLISVAGCGDANGCADDDDVCAISDLYVTQITGLAAIDEDGTWVGGAGTEILHTPSNSGTGDNFFGANYIQFTVSSFSEFWIHGSETGVPLPVELIEFTAKAVNNEFIQLDWTTGTEINNQGFDVQRSLNGIDFESIAFVSGNGNSNSILNYTYQDTEINEGLYYYRLEQRDFDGATELSDIRSARLDKINLDQISYFVPNPADNSSRLQFELNGATAVSVSIYDNTGKIVYDAKARKEAGTQSISINTSGLAVGTYLARIVLNNEVVMRKLVINR